MKKKIYLSALLLPLGIAAFLLQGCYTQFATMREEEPSYTMREEEPSYEKPYSQQNDSTYYDENENCQAQSNIGFSYYYPYWSSCWAWDYGCIYPTYWDPWFWGPAFYIGYSYYPHYWGYWNNYPRYNHWGFGSHYAYSRSFATRNFGYQRSENSRGTYGNVGAGSVRGSVIQPHTAGTAIQTTRNSTTRNTRNVSGGVSTNRQSTGSRYNLSVQQPRHRDQSGSKIIRSYRIGSSRGRENYRNQGSSSGQSRSSGRSSAPSYSPQPSTRSSSAPSAPASRNDGGGGRSSGSGRSR